MIPDDGFNEFFKRLLEHMRQDMEGMGGMSRFFESMKDEDTKTITRSWGIRVRQGADGKMIIERFGDTPIEQESEGSMQPLIDIFEEGDEYIIVADVPGVEEDSLIVDLREEEGKRTLVISSLDERRKYHKELEIPPHVANDFERAYRNGVLELRFKMFKGE